MQISFSWLTTLLLLSLTSKEVISKPSVFWDGANHKMNRQREGSTKVQIPSSTPFVDELALSSRDAPRPYSPRSPLNLGKKLPARPPPRSESYLDQKVEISEGRLISIPIWNWLNDLLKKAPLDVFSSSERSNYNLLDTGYSYTSKSQRMSTGSFTEILSNFPKKSKKFLATKWLQRNQNLGSWIDETCQITNALRRASDRSSLSKMNSGLRATLFTNALTLLQAFMAVYGLPLPVKEQNALYQRLGEIEQPDSKAPEIVFSATGKNSEQLPEIFKAFKLLYDGMREVLPPRSSWLQRKDPQKRNDRSLPRRSGSSFTPTTSVIDQDFLVHSPSQLSQDKTQNYVSASPRSSIALSSDSFLSSTKGGGPRRASTLSSASVRTSNNTESYPPYKSRNGIKASDSSSPLERSSSSDDKYDNAKKMREILFHRVHANKRRVVPF
ncbi:MAG: hypothetical protein DHS80DRAFT_21469 [Piptocephalis tieghemiana]|nr:MAG: hypothetical protein DHS80DRAFT_21469 [Piptocephalis tieghemiana]